jgi:hypothetical protein
MKKIYSFLMLFVSVTMLSLCVSCSSDDEDSPLQSKICGTWRITAIYKDSGTPIDVTTYPGNILMSPTYATFNEDGTYYGKGYFGTGYGTYKISGTNIYTYVGGEEYIHYEVLDYTDTTCKLKIEMTGSTKTLTVKCTKQ